MDQGVETLIAQCVAERDALREQVTNLQNKSTEQCEEIRELKVKTEALTCIHREYQRVLDEHVPHNVYDFMYATKTLPDVDGPHIPDEATLRLRLRLVAEEFCELLDACFNGNSDTDETTAGYRISKVKDRLWTLVLDPNDPTPLDVNLTEVADALADLDYVNEGFRLACGIDGGPIAAEVHRSNMTKLPFTKDAGGKVTKGQNYEPPDVLRVLREQGYSG